LTSGAGPPVLSASELGEFLIAPDAGERLSAMDGPGCVVLDLSDSPSTQRLPLKSLARIRSQLPILPCVTVALISESDLTDAASDEDVAVSLAAICDVRIGDQSGLAALLSGFAKTPLAALCFVQLLRSASSASIHAGLVAESFVYSTLQAGPEFASWLSSRRSKRKPDPSKEPACRVERDRNRLEILLSRPEKHNAFSRGMRDSLCEALQLALADPTLEDVVLRGEGPSFCSGGDLDEFGSIPDPAQAHAIRTTRSPALLVSQLGGRIRSEVHGACIGAGAELPAFTNRVVADEDAFFALPEVALGLIPGAGGTVSLPRRIGRQRTAWLGLSGARIDSHTALDWGLVDEVRLGFDGGS
jgi:Enoyl-CoA hydratase/isomerase